MGWGGAYLSAAEGAKRGELPAERGRGELPRAGLPARGDWERPAILQHQSKLLKYRGRYIVSIYALKLGVFRANQN